MNILAERAPWHTVIAPVPPPALTDIAPVFHPCLLYAGRRGRTRRFQPSHHTRRGIRAKIVLPVGHRRPPTQPFIGQAHFVIMNRRSDALAGSPPGFRDSGDHPMHKRLIRITALALVPIGAAACVSKSEYTKAVQSAEVRYNALEAQNARLKSDLADAGKRNDELERTLSLKSGELGKSIVDLRRRVGALEDDKSRLTQELADANKAREEKVREVSSTYEQLVAKMKGEIDKGQVTISELKGKLTVNMVEAILFDSGKAEVKQEGLVVLGKVIEILKTVNDKSIRIEGHTDNKPIVRPLTQRYPTNWELSAARAINVARYLQKQGIEPGSLSAAAFGEFKSVADNATPEGRAKNRRIEIVLVPKE
jgi:chemotaxis protein MotB